MAKSVSPRYRLSVRARSWPLGPAGGALVEPALVGAGEDAPGQRRPGHHPHAALHAVRDHLPLLLPVDQVVVVLHGDERRPAVPLGGQLQFDELPREHRRGAQVEDLARPHDVVERLHRLLDRRRGRRRARRGDGGGSPAGRCSRGRGGAARRRPLPTRACGTGRPGSRPRPMGMAILVASTYSLPREQLAEQAADHLLAGADAVDVGAVEGEQAALDGPRHDRAGLVDVERPVALVAPARDPEVHRAQAEARDPEPAPAQLDGVEHATPPRRPMAAHHPDRRA